MDHAVCPGRGHASRPSTKNAEKRGPGPFRPRITTPDPGDDPSMRLASVRTLEPLEIGRSTVAGDGIRWLLIGTTPAVGTGGSPKVPPHPLTATANASVALLRAGKDGRGERIGEHSSRLGRSTVTPLTVGC
jgi:hypothetical protein